MDSDPDEYNMEEVRLDNKIDHHWRMVFEGKTEGCTMRKRFYMLRCGVSTLGDISPFPLTLTNIWGVSKRNPSPPIITPGICLIRAPMVMNVTLIFFGRVTLPQYILGVTLPLIISKCFPSNSPLIP